MRIIQCPVCNQEIKAHVYPRHLRKHDESLYQELIKSKKKEKLYVIENNVAKCLICGQIGKRQAITSHIFFSHTEEGKLAHRRAGRRTGSGFAWNKGLTKETDERVAQYGKRYSERIASGEIEPAFKNCHHTVESKIRISKGMSENNNGGRCSWYEVNGVNVQGTWERDFVVKLNELGISWEKVKKHAWKYIMNEKIRHYTPDFYLPSYDVFIEIKGYWWGNDKEKMKYVLDQHKDKKLIIIEKADFEKVMQGELVW